MRRKRRAPETLIGCSAAGRLMSRSPQIVKYWAATGRIKTVRKRPYKFRVSDVIDAISCAPAPRPTWGRKRGASQIDTIMKEIL